MPRYFLLTVITVFILSACEVRREDAFLKAYKEMKNKLAPYEEDAYLDVSEWEKILGGRVLLEYEIQKKLKLKMRPYEQWRKSSKSPFAPYLGKNFNEGFTVKQVEQQQIAVEQLDCKNILDLELGGFLNLYPFLRPVFFDRADKEDLIKVFHQLAYWRAIAPKYCRSALSLKKTYNNAKRLGFVFPLHQARYFSHKKFTTEFAPAEQRAALLDRCWAMGSVIDYAVRDGYRPAIIMVLNLMKRQDGVGLPPDMEYYLRKKAGKLGVKQNNLTSHYQKLRRRISQKNIQVLDDRIKANNPSREWVQHIDCAKL